MPRQARKNKARQCEGVEGTKEKCTLSRDGEKNPISLNKACARCGQWRCKTHCACGQAGELTGQKRGRPPVDARAMPRDMIAETSPQEATEKPNLSSLHPVGRRSPLSVETFVADPSWWERALEETKHASHIMVSSFLYDEPSLQAMLKQRLQSRSACNVSVLIDEAEYKARRARHQRPRLMELRDLGAAVYLCQGGECKALFGQNSYLGNYHVKALILDRRVMYTGSSNMTLSSRKNIELMFRMTGPPVHAVLQGLQTLILQPSTCVLGARD